jgi:hypothetical protein
MDRSKAERLAEFMRRLQALAPARSLEQARFQVETTLNLVEDEWTSIPFDQAVLDPSAGRPGPSDRMYSPQDDSMRSVPGHPGVKRFISFGKHTFIAANGAIEIRSARAADGSIARPPESGPLLFSKRGADGLGVWE